MRTWIPASAGMTQEKCDEIKKVDYETSSE